MTSSFTAFLAKTEKEYYLLLEQNELEQAEQKRRIIEDSIKKKFPLLMEDVTIAFYGTGRISACILSFLERFFKERKASLVFLHTFSQTGRKFRGYPIINIKDIHSVHIDRIVIASVNAENPIRKELEMAGVEGIPQESVPEDIFLLLDNYKQFVGQIHKPPAISISSGIFTKEASPFYIDGLRHSGKQLLSSFPELREKVLGVIITDSSTTHIQGIPYFPQLPAEAEADRRYVRRLSDVLLEYLEYGETVEYHPVSVRMEASTICQLNCADCYMRLNDSGTVGVGYLRADLLKQFLDKNPEIREIELSNSGEPFCNPQMREILEMLHERGIRIQFWGGVNLNDVPDEVLEALVRCEVDTMVVSIDGVTQEVYEQYRRGGRIEKVYANIEKINKWKKHYDTPYPALKWQFILMNHNQHEAAAAVKEAEKLGMEMIFKPDWSGSFVPDDPEQLYAITGLQSLNHNEYAIKEGHQYLSDILCAQMIVSPQINWDGRVLGCCCVYQQDWGINAFETPLSELFNNANYRSAVVSLLTGRDGMDHTGPCRECFTYRENVINNMYPLLIL